MSSQGIGEAHRLASSFINVIALNHACKISFIKLIDFLEVAYTRYAKLATRGNCAINVT